MKLKDLEVGQLFKLKGSNLVLRKDSHTSIFGENKCDCSYGNKWTLGVFRSVMNLDKDTAVEIVEVEE